MAVTPWGSVVGEQRTQVQGLTFCPSHSICSQNQNIWFAGWVVNKSLVLNLIFFLQLIWYL